MNRKVYNNDGGYRVKYELEIMGLDEKTGNADAICFRFFSETKNKFIVGVYDGGTKIYGSALVDHIKKYYFKNEEKLVIDFIICSHPDQDHVTGLETLFDNFKVKKIYINRPWLYTDELFGKINDGRITKHTLEERLKEKYCYVKNLEIKAKGKGTEIKEAFQGEVIEDYLKILSPTKDFYLNLIVKSSKTPLREDTFLLNNLYEQGKKIKEVFSMVIETWKLEMLRDNVKTSEENESSVVVYGDMLSDSFLLVGDAGIKALDLAIIYAERVGIDLKKVGVYQIPHHGGRHNVSTSILNRLLGPVIQENIELQNKRIAFVSVAKDSDHPRKMVTNAYIRRGVIVYEARTKILRHHHKMEIREGWGTPNSMKFSKKVESWE